MFIDAVCFLVAALGPQESMPEMRSASATLGSTNDLMSALTGVGAQPTRGRSAVSARTDNSPMGRQSAAVLGPKLSRAGRARGAGGPSYQIGGKLPGADGAARGARGGSDLADALGMTGAGAGAAKWDLVGAGRQAALPAALMGVLSGGPLSAEEAKALVAALTGATEPVAGTGTAGKSFGDTSASIYAQSPDPEFVQMQSALDEGDHRPAETPPRTVDAEALRTWFDRLDLSKDESISFLEWRDGTGLGLDLFRRVDSSGEGLVRLDEFGTPLIINGAKSGRTVDPKLLEWVTQPVTTSVAPDAAQSAATPPSADAPASATPPAAVTAAPLSEEEVIARARAAVASLALQRTKAAAAAAAAGPAGNKSAAKSAAKKPAIPNFLNPAGKGRSPAGTTGVPLKKPAAPSAKPSESLPKSAAPAPKSDAPAAPAPAPKTEAPAPPSGETGDKGASGG